MDAICKFKPLKDKPSAFNYFIWLINFENFHLFPSHWTKALCNHDHAQCNIISIILTFSNIKTMKNFPNPNTKQFQHLFSTRPINYKHKLSREKENGKWKKKLFAFVLTQIFTRQPLTRDCEKTQIWYQQKTNFSLNYECVWMNLNFRNDMGPFIN